jgi:hypothetical protein
MCQITPNRNMARRIESRTIEYRQTKRNILKPIRALVPKIAVWVIELSENIK